MSRDIRLWKNNNVSETMEVVMNSDIARVHKIIDMCETILESGFLEDHELNRIELMEDAALTWLEMLMTKNIDLTNAIAGG